MPIHGKPWEHDSCEAEGAPCVCNPEGTIQLDELFAEVPTDEPKH